MTSTRRSDLDMNHRPTPRTLEEVFGPGPHHLTSDGEPMHACDRIVLAGVAVAFVAWLLIEVFL